MNRFTQHHAIAETQTHTDSSAVTPTFSELLALRLPASQLPLTEVHHVRARAAGSHASRHVGRGMDYEESRRYQAGDDIRHMDWRVTARSAEAHTKLFQEERERPVLVMADFGRSMFFGTRRTFKSVLAARAAALIGWAAIAHGDRIGALLNCGTRIELKPTGGRRGALRLIHGLVHAADPVAALDAREPVASLNDALEALQHFNFRGSLIYLLSDFNDIDPTTSTLVRRLHRNSEVVLIQISDPIETRAPPPSRYAVSDDSGASYLNLTTRKQCLAYENFFSARAAAVRELALDLGLTHLNLSTDVDVVDSLRDGFAKYRIRPAASRMIA